MADYGRIIAAGTEVDGSELATDHDAGVTVLDLEDALDFYEPSEGETIQVRILADDDTEELVTIKVPETEDEDTVDEFDGFLHLAAPTVNAYDEGTRVLVHPETKRRLALVRLDDAEEDSETVDAIVDAALYEKIPEGTDLDMAVELAYDGEAYYVVNILGEESAMDILANSITGNDSLNVYGDEIIAEATGALRLSGSEIHLQASTEFINMFAPLTIQLVTNPGGYVELGIDGPRIITGSGSPDGVVAAPIGSIYLRTDSVVTGAIFFKKSGTGTSGWASIGE